MPLGSLNFLKEKFLMLRKLLKNDIMSWYVYNDSNDTN